MKFPFHRATTRFRSNPYSRVSPGVPASLRLIHPSRCRGHFRVLPLSALLQARTRHSISRYRGLPNDSTLLRMPGWDCPMLLLRFCVAINLCVVGVSREQALPDLPLAWIRSLPCVFYGLRRRREQCCASSTSSPSGRTQNNNEFSFASSDPWHGLYCCLAGHRRSSALHLEYATVRHSRFELVFKWSSEWDSCSAGYIHSKHYSH